jgi:hypothetical protein
MKRNTATIGNVSLCIFIVLETWNSINETYESMWWSKNEVTCGAICCKHIKLCTPIVAKRWHKIKVFCFYEVTHKKSGSSLKTCTIFNCIVHSRKMQWKEEEILLIFVLLFQVQRAKTNNHKEMLTSCKRVAQYCMKHWRQKAMQVSRPDQTRLTQF